MEALIQLQTKIRSVIDTFYSTMKSFGENPCLRRVVLADRA